MQAIKGVSMFYARSSRINSGIIQVEWMCFGLVLLFFVHFNRRTRQNVISFRLDSQVYDNIVCCIAFAVSSYLTLFHTFFYQICWYENKVHMDFAFYFHVYCLFTAPSLCMPMRIHWILLDEFKGMAKRTKVSNWNTTLQLIQLTGIYRNEKINLCELTKTCCCEMSQTQQFTLYICFVAQ